MWYHKTKHYFKPKFHLNPNYYNERRWDHKKSKFRYHSQNPLYFDYEKLYLNSGIQPYIDKVKELGRQDIPMNKRAYMIYHMG
jgi:hypothetical protein